MSMQKSTIALIALAFLAGCGTKPVPLIAVAGTTITVAIPGDFKVGYGLRLSQALNPSIETPSGPAYDANSPYEDPQRGDLVFSLYTNSGSPSFVRHLVLAYITRVNASPQSEAATQSAIVSLVEQGQNLAFLNIPYDIAADNYLIQVRRYRRASTSPYAYQLDPNPLPQTSQPEDYLGWGGDSAISGMPTSARGIPITIRAGDGANHFTPFKGWGDAGGSYHLTWTDLAPLVDGFVPAPHFDIQVPVAVTDPRPSAWSISLAYPKNKIRITGVELKREGNKGAMVRWDADQTAVVNCSDGLPAFLNIQVVDPDKVTLGVKVAYELRNFGQSCGGRANSSTFVEWMNTFQAFDQNGDDLTTTYSIPSSSFL
jgi:hypothetical protein